MNNRPKVTVFIAMSLDGYIARKDGNLDWLDSIEAAGEDHGYQKMYKSIDAVILGRHTYEKVLSFGDWPYSEKKVYVLSHSLKTGSDDVELCSGDPKHVISKLKSDRIQHVWVDGGLTISKFLSLNIVDSMIVTIIPVILGSGIPLFNGIEKDISCHLVSSQSYSSGLVQLRYELERE